MIKDEGRQGSRPGSTFQDMRQKARAGQLRGPQFPHDGVCEPGYGKPTPTMAGQGTSVVNKRPIVSSRTGNSPYERPVPYKPGA